MRRQMIAFSDAPRRERRRSSARSASVSFNPVNRGECFTLSRRSNLFDPRKGVMITALRAEH